jgi:hypothetical protein
LQGFFGWGLAIGLALSTVSLHAFGALGLTALRAVFLGGLDSGLRRNDGIPSPE